MRIGIDVRMIFPFQTGIGNYRRNLIEALFQIDKESEYVLVGNGKQQSVFSKQFKRRNVSFSVIKSKANHPLQHLLLPLELKKLNLDIFYTTHWGATLRMPGKYVLEIPDLIYHHYPEFGSWKSKFYEFLLEKHVARNADAVVTISNFVKNDIVTMLGVDESKVTNIKGAVSREYRMIEDEKYIEKVLQEYSLVAGQYFVYLGNQRPHKNLVRLLQAFEEFCENLPPPRRSASSLLRQEGKVRLVIIGGVDAKGRDQDSLRIKTQLEKMASREDVLLLGRVDRESTAAIFNRAISLVHPSLHEGFGLTPLEAMSCGCPVISSNITSVPEVVKGAGILVNPRDISEILEAMVKVYSDADFRKELSKKSLERAKEFSWMRTAGMLKEVFEKCYSKLN